MERTKSPPPNVAMYDVNKKTKIICLYHIYVCTKIYMYVYHENGMYIYMIYVCRTPKMMSKTTLKHFQMCKDFSVDG